MEVVSSVRSFVAARYFFQKLFFQDLYFNFFHYRKTGKMAQMQRTKGDSSDVNTATTGTSTGSNTSTSRTATPNDDLSYQDDLGHHTSSSATSDPMSVHYRPGDDLQMPVSKSSPSVSLTSSIASPASLGVWLDELNLGQYKDTYTKNGCTSLEQVLQLTSRYILCFE